MELNYNLTFRTHANEKHMMQLLQIQGVKNPTYCLLIYA